MGNICVGTTTLEKLRKAYHKNNEDVFRELLDNDAHVDISGLFKELESALEVPPVPDSPKGKMLAMMSKRIEAKKAIEGAKVKIRNLANYIDEEDYPSRRKAHLEQMLKLLRQYGEDIDVSSIRTGLGGTLLHVAVKYIEASRARTESSEVGLRIEMMVLLTKLGVDWNCVDAGRLTPRDYALKNLENKWDGVLLVNIIDHIRSNYTKESEQSDADRALLECESIKDIEDCLGTGADIDAVDINGCTILHLMARDGRLDVVEYLLSKGSSPFARNNSGKTPRVVALDAGRVGVVEHFKGYIASLDLSYMGLEDQLEIARSQGDLEKVDSVEEAIKTGLAFENKFVLKIQRSNASMHGDQLDAQSWRLEAQIGAQKEWGAEEGGHAASVKRRKVEGAAFGDSWGGRT